MIQNPVGYVPPVVRNLIIINIIMFVAAQMMPQLYGWLVLYYPTSPYFKPLQIVSYMFMHATFGHILFNMLSLWIFGSILEGSWGPQRFLAFYLICGFAAVPSHWALISYQLSQGDAMAINSGLLGASGATVGLLGAFGACYPNMEMRLMIPPISMPAKYFVLLYGIFQYSIGMNGAERGVAHFAHLGGLLAGMILVIAWKKQKLI